MSTARHPTPPLTVANINIERSKHLPQVMSFLARIAADVVCLQELIVDDLFKLSRSLGHAHHAYVPMALHPGDGLIRPFGIGILSRIPILRSESIPYAGLGSGRDLVDLSSGPAAILLSWPPLHWLMRVSRSETRISRGRRMDPLATINAGPVID